MHFDIPSQITESGPLRLSNMVINFPLQCIYHKVPHPLLSSLHLLNKPITQPYLQSGDGPIVLVLAPTRELALQIKQECDKFGASSEIKNTVVYGGVPKSTQVRDLRYDAYYELKAAVLYIFFSDCPSFHRLKLKTFSCQNFDDFLYFVP